MHRSPSEPPLDKLEQLRIKYSKNTKTHTQLNFKAFNSVPFGKSISNDTTSYGKNSFLEKMQSIHSQEDDEKTLLKSIQIDVTSVLQRYQQRMESINKIIVQRQSLKSACDFSCVYQVSMSPKEIKENLKSANSQKQNIEIDTNKKSNLKKNTNIGNITTDNNINNNTTNGKKYIFKIFAQKQKEKKKVKPELNKSNQTSKANTTRQSSITKEISINLCKIAATKRKKK